ncbi:MAG TPA: C10 family peptidase [Bacteroidales bacterium]|nr:C10 family peptidase [Bacteroidales bacterium]HSA44108.1 C10 family peptidase [Bacteroidales bacterium]
MRITRFTLTALIMCLLLQAGQAKEVDRATARKAALHLYYERANQQAQLPFSKISIASEQSITDASGIPYYHVFTFDGGGFVIITAEDILQPVIGYSTRSTYSDDAGNLGFRTWMGQIKEQIDYYRAQGTAAHADVSREWERLLDDEFISKPLAKSGKNVQPLMITQWGQGKYYNTLTPSDPNGEEGHCPVGCVATSMAQIMFYYRYPETGQGAHGYNANNPNYGNYGWQEANFGATTYLWDEMVLKANEANMALATLCYHLGVSVNMSYGPNASGSFTNLVPSAMSAYFKYDAAIQYIQKMNYSSSTWEAMMIANLDNKQPLIYSGANSDGGHAWNCDGYENTGGTNMFHFNWGWDGYSDGFYAINNLTPGGDPPYNQNNGAVRNIYPASGYPAYCGGNKVLTGTKGTFEDGSGMTLNYQDNASCSWLIAPTDTVSKIVLTFNLFNTESNNDVVTVYDGADASAPVLLTHSGSTLPSGTYTSTSNRMFITFTSNGSTAGEGFYASFRSNYPKFCQGTNLSSPNGTVSDGSGPLNYLNNTVCSWTIQPPFGKNLNLHFTYFNLEDNVDYVKVYDLATQTLLATYSGTNMPADVTAASGSMYIEFKTNYVYTYGGWEAEYSVGNLGLDENSGFSDINIYPNPSRGILNLQFSQDMPGEAEVLLMNLTGQILRQENTGRFSGQYKGSFDLSDLAKGVYLLKLSNELGSYQQRLVIQ